MKRWFFFFVPLTPLSPSHSTKPRSVAQQQIAEPFCLPQPENSLSQSEGFLFTTDDRSADLGNKNNNKKKSSASCLYLYSFLIFMSKYAGLFIRNPSAWVGLKGGGIYYTCMRLIFFLNQSPCNASVQGRPTINVKSLHIPSTHIGTTNVDATDTLEAVTSWVSVNYTYF